jgi:hypothetical protein
MNDGFELAVWIEADLFYDRSDDRLRNLTTILSAIRGYDKYAQAELDFAESEGVCDVYDDVEDASEVENEFNDFSPSVAEPAAEKLLRGIVGRDERVHVPYSGQVTDNLFGGCK